MYRAESKVWPVYPTDKVPPRQLVQHATDALRDFFNIPGTRLRCSWPTSDQIINNNKILGFFVVFVVVLINTEGSQLALHRRYTSTTTKT